MTDQPDVASEIARLLDADEPNAAELQIRVRKGGVPARAAVIALASGAHGADRSTRLRYRAAVLAADACGDETPVRSILADASEDPAGPVLSELLAASSAVARIDGRALRILTDAAVTADLLTTAIDARPDDPIIADAVLESLGDASGFSAATRPVRSRENAAKVMRNGMSLLARSTDDRVVQRLEQVLLARMTSAASAANDDILRAVLASPTGRGRELIEDLARAGAPGVQRQAQRMLDGGTSADGHAQPAASSETAAVLLDIAQLQGARPLAPPSEPETEPASEPGADSAPTTEPERSTEHTPDTATGSQPDSIATPTPEEPTPEEPTPETAPPTASESEPTPASTPASAPTPGQSRPKRSWLARLFGRRTG